MTPRRIALVSEHASPAALIGGADAGGQNIYVDQLACRLAELGHAVDIFTRRDAAAAPAVMPWAPGVRIINLDAGPAAEVPKDGLWPAMMAEFRDALRRFIRDDPAGYDVVHSHFWMSGWAAVEVKRRLGLPVVHIYHALGTTKHREQGAADTSPRDRISVEMSIGRRADAIIAQCPSERAELIGDYAVPPGKIGIIPAGVNLERFRPVSRAEARDRIGIEPGRPVIVYVGRLLPRKDVGNIVRALALLRRRDPAPGEALPLLLVVGGATPEPDPVRTPEIGALRRLAAEAGVADLVRFTGHRQPDVLRYYYGAADVVVTTPWYEPFGLTPLEAMACGRPVIGAAVGGLTSTLQDGVTGYLVPPRDPSALADRLALMLTHPELGERMGRAGRSRVERTFGWPLTATRTAALYEAILAARAPAPAESPADRRRRGRVAPRAA